MTEDARFEDGREAPLNLGALDAEDLTVIASLTRLEVEALEVTLKDVTRPYVAPSKKRPVHPE